MTIVAWSFGWSKTATGPVVATPRIRKSHCVHVNNTSSQWINLCLSTLLIVTQQQCRQCSCKENSKSLLFCSPEKAAGVETAWKIRKSIPSCLSSLFVRLNSQVNHKCSQSQVDFEMESQGACFNFFATKWDEGAFFLCRKTMSALSTFWQPVPTKEFELLGHESQQTHVNVENVLCNFWINCSEFSIAIHLLLLFGVYKKLRHLWQVLWFKSAGRGSNYDFFWVVTNVSYLLEVLERTFFFKIREENT